MTTTRTDLVEAFKDLRKQHVYARANFKCCGSCASYAIGEKLREQPTRYDGGAYWHAQDESAARDGHPVLIGFGAPDDESTVRVGHKVVEVLTKHGIACVWDGSAATRIAALVPEWN